MDMDIFETGHTRLRRTLRNILPVIIPAVLCLIFYLGISCAGTVSYTHLTLPTTERV